MSLSSGLEEGNQNKLVIETSSVRLKLASDLMFQECLRVSAVCHSLQESLTQEAVLGSVFGACQVDGIHISQGTPDLQTMHVFYWLRQTLIGLLKPDVTSL